MAFYEDFPNSTEKIYVKNKDSIKNTWNHEKYFLQKE